jgi:hypothetical protein
MRYGLAWNPNPPITLSQWVTFAVIVGVNAVLVFFGVVAVPFAAIGVSAFYVAIGFMIPFALWFGLWGIIAAYLGAFIGGSLGGFPIAVGWYISSVDIIQVIVPFVLYRACAARFGLDPLASDLYSRHWLKAWVFFVLSSVFFQNVIAASLNMFILVRVGLMPAGVFWPAVTGWVVGDLIVIPLIMPVVCKFLSPVVERSGLVVRGWIS